MSHLSPEQLSDEAKKLIVEYIEKIDQLKTKDRSRFEGLCHRPFSAR